MFDDKKCKKFNYIGAIEWQAIWYGVAQSACGLHTSSMTNPSREITLKSVMIWWELPKSLMHLLLMVQTKVHSRLSLGRSSVAHVSHIIRLGGELVSPTLMMQSILKISFTILLFLPSACHSLKRWGTGFTNWFFISSLSFHKSRKARFCKKSEICKGSIQR